MYGVMLRTLGHNVHILEQSGDIRESHMAGVCCAADALEYFRRFDRISTPFSLRCERLQFLKQSGLISHYLKAPRLVTSWDVLYWRLRANFDGYASDYYPDPPPIDFEGSGSGFFWARTKVISVEVDAKGKGVIVRYEREGESAQELTADLVLGADGPSSAIRQKFYPESQRQYSGYVAWRGTVPESDVSPETLRLLEKNVTLNLMTEDHAVV